MPEFESEDEDGLARLCLACFIFFALIACWVLLKMPFYSSEKVYSTVAEGYGEECLLEAAERWPGGLRVPRFPDVPTGGESGSLSLYISKNHILGRVEWLELTLWLDGLVGYVAVMRDGYDGSFQYHSRTVHEHEFLKETAEGIRIYKGGDSLDAIDPGCWCEYGVCAVGEYDCAIYLNPWGTEDEGIWADESWYLPIAEAVRAMLQENIS